MRWLASRPVRGVVLAAAVLMSTLAGLILVTNRSNIPPEFSGEQLVYIGEDGQLWLVTVDRLRRRRLTAHKECANAGIHWSPNGDRLACLADYSGDLGPNDENKLVLVHLTKGIVRQTQWVDSLVWSTTGTHLAFRISLDYPPGTGAGLFLLDAEGHAAGRVSLLRGNFVWSPDGSTLAFASDRGEPTFHHVATQRQRTLPQRIDNVLRWLPNGNLVVGRRTSSAPDSPWEYSFVNVATGARRPIPARWFSFHSWASADGRKMLIARDGFLSVVDLVAERAVRISGSSYRGLGDNDISVWPAEFSDDGQYVYWGGEAEHGRAVYRAPSDGSGLERIATLPGGIASFSPGARRIAYVVPDTPSVLWTAVIDGTNRRKIGPFPLEGGTASWRPSRVPVIR